MAEIQRIRITHLERENGKKVPITRKTWHDYVQDHPELKPDGEDSARWTGLGKDEFCLLVWRDGEIEALNPPPALVKKMAELAAGIGAVAQGERGELYDAQGGSTAPVPSQVALRAKDLAGKERPPEPRRLDPLTWQIVAWGFFGGIAVFATIVFVILARRVW
jgi:hypothetical protein